MTSPRVRFAPSPTGYLHVGSARTALFNWLYARRHGGTFVLRIEDTDVERSREEWVDGILTTLEWLGMTPDEGPYRQSARLDRYTEAVDRLWGEGRLYACECTREQVLARTADAPAPGYDGYCRDRGLERGPGRALRFRTPDEGATVVRDVIRGDVSFPHEAMEDFVVARSSGQPLFVLSNTVDDREMAISHVIRGEDLFPSTPKGLLLWSALDEVEDAAPAVPAFAHLPLLVDERRKKLSKRREEVAVEAYRDTGYLPEAFRNYLALLGWSPPGDQEKVPLEVLVGTFDLEQVHSAPAFFDVHKLTHMNGEYTRELSAEDFVAACQPWVAPGNGWRPSIPPPWPPERYESAAFERIAPFVQERVGTLGEVPAMIDFLFLPEPVMDEDAWQRGVVREQHAAAILDDALSTYATCAWTPDVLHDVTRQIGESVGRSLAKAQAPIRVAVTGRRVGPPLFESLAVLGREEVLLRLDRARQRVTSDPA